MDGCGAAASVPAESSSVSVSIPRKRQWILLEGRKLYVSCCRETDRAQTEPRQTWRSRRYSSSSVPTEERWAARTCATCAPPMCRRSTGVRGSSCGEVEEEKARRWWWPGPGWGCAGPGTVRGHVRDSTCVNTSCSAAAAPSPCSGKQHVSLQSKQQQVEVRWKNLKLACCCCCALKCTREIPELFLK